MAKKIYLPFLEVKPIEELPETTSLIPGNMMIESDEGDTLRIRTESFYQILNNFAKALKITAPAPTVDGWYKPEDAGTYANAGGLVAQEGYDTLFEKIGSTWTRTQVKMPESKISTWISQSYVSGKQVFYQGKIYEANVNAISTDVPGVSSKWDEKITSFSEEEFNQAAESFNTYSILSRDLSAVAMPNEIAAGAGSSIFTVILTEDNKISKLRVKVANSGIGNFSYKRSGTITALLSNITLVTGWNDVHLDFQGISGDYIGYNTATSTSRLFFGDDTGGNYYNAAGTVFNGNIALEVYKAEIKSNTFEELATMDISNSGNTKLGTKAFNAINSLSTPKLRNFDYGVVSAFSSTDWVDIMGNNKIKESGSISGIFPLKPSFNFSFGFVVKFPTKYTTSKLVANIDFGGFSSTIYADSAGFTAFRNGGSQNSTTYDYGNKEVSIVLKGNAYFMGVWADGHEIGYFNINTKVNKVAFNFPQSDSQEIKHIVLWNREISTEKLISWKDNLDPFILASPQDKFYPPNGIQLSDKFLEGNKNFYIPAEQTIIKFNGKYLMYFTIANSTPTEFIESGIGVAISDRPDGGFMMYTDDAVIGGERNKAGVTRAMASWACEKDGFVYVFAAMEYNLSAAGGKIFKSSDGKSFTFVNNITSSIGAIPYFANIGMCKTPVNGFYYGIIEGKASGGAPWSLYLVKSSNFEGPYTVVGSLPSLNIYGSSGGPDLMRSANNDRWICVYHACHNAAGSIYSPTDIFWAECKDDEPINWTKKGRVMAISDELDSYCAYNCDQVATPGIFEDNGKTYMNYVLAQNHPTLHCQIRSVEFDGTKEELFGLVPLEYGFKSPFINPNASTFTKVIMSGTSIANGIGSDGGSGITESNTSRVLLRNRLSNNLDRVITVVNGGVNGQNTSGMKTNLPALLAGNTGQIVILEGAINDAQTAGVGLPTATSTSNLSDMIDLVIASGNIPILTTPMPIDISVTAIAAAYTLQKRADLVTAIRNLASSKGVELVDLDLLANNNLGLLVDGLHPNPNGYLLIGNGIFNVIYSRVV